MDTFRVMDYKLNELREITGIPDIKDDVVVFYSSYGRLSGDIIAAFNTKNVWIIKKD